MPLPASKYQKLFSKLDQPKPPADLAQKTLRAIVVRERKIIIAKLIGFGALLIASLAVVVTELTSAGAQLGQSGFFQFGSLFFSDFGSAIGNLPDMILSLVESFPILSAGLALGGIAIAAWSFIGFVDDANLLRATRSL